MSDSILRYVPADPFWQPSAEAADNAATLLKAHAPTADAVEPKFEDSVRFYDPGENWSGVECSSCGADAEVWWGEAMAQAFDNDFESLDVKAPCCGTVISLNDLRYVWPAAFGRFALEALNPGIEETTAEQDHEMAECLGAPLRKIWVRV